MCHMSCVTSCMSHVTVSDMSQVTSKECWTKCWSYLGEGLLSMGLPCLVFILSARKLRVPLLRWTIYFISNRTFWCFSCILAMVHWNSPTLGNLVGADWVESLRWVHTEPSMHFRKADTEPSMHFRKAYTEPSMQLRKAHTEPSMYFRKANTWIYISFRLSVYSLFHFQFYFQLNSQLYSLFYSQF